MAHSTFDPLRSDPFAEHETSGLAVTQTQSNNQWSLGQNQGSQHTEDILLQFNNVNNSSSQLPSDDVRVTRRKRQDSSSSTISALSVKSKPGVSAILDDLTIAPPPEPPVTKDYNLSMQLMDEDNSPLPEFAKIKHSGSCLARISLRSLIMKKWKRVFWIAYGDDMILVFKTKKRFEHWAMNPYLSESKREKMVKLRLIFPSQQTIGLKGYVTSSIKMKKYSVGVLHQFKVDRWYGDSPTIAAAFASESVQDVHELHLIVREMIRHSPESARFAEITFSNDSSSGNFSGSYSVSSWGGSSNGEASERSRR